MRKSWFAIAALSLALVGSELFAGKGGNGGGKPGGGGEPAPDPAIAFVFGPDGELAVMNEDGSNRTIILTEEDGAGTVLNTPCWSPDGTQLAFLYDDGVNGKGIYTLDVVVDGTTVSGENLAIVASIPAAQSFNANPAWSPVPVFGKYRIAFSRLDESRGDGQIYLVNADGTGELTHLGKARGDVSWSPSGDRLASTPNSKSIKIHHLEQDATSGAIYVGDSPRYDLYDNSGGERLRVRRIDWARTQDHVLAAGVYNRLESDLWIVDLRDGVLDPDATPEDVDVYVLDTQIVLASTSAGEGYPTWAPDDLSLLYALEGTGKAGIYALDDLSGSGDPTAFYRHKKRSVFWPDWRR